MGGWDWEGERGEGGGKREERGRGKEETNIQLPQHPLKHSNNPAITILPRLQHLLINTMLNRNRQRSNGLPPRRRYSRVLRFRKKRLDALAKQLIK